MTTDNRANEPTDAQRQKAAAELRIRYGAGSGSHPWIEFQGNPRLIVDQVLAAAGVATQEPSRLPDFFAPKPMPNSYVPAPVLPSSGIDEDALAEVERAAAARALREFAQHLIESVMPEHGSHINMTPYREGLVDGVNRAVTAAGRRAAEIREKELTK